MGRLIDPERRKRARQESERRRAEILVQARSCFLEQPFSEVTLEVVARRAGTKAGFASMYFVDREHLALGLLREELAGWFTALEAALGRPTGRRRSLPRLAAVVGRTLVGRPLLLRLLEAMPTLLEVGLPATEVFTLLSWQRDRLQAPGRVLERAVPALGPGGGVRVLVELQLQVAAVQLLATPRGSLAVALADPQLAWLRRDLEVELVAWLAGRLAACGASSANRLK